MGAQQVIVNSDSELMVRQIQGSYRVKNADLKPLYSEVVKLVYGLASFQIVCVPRERNQEADELANKAFHKS